MPSRDGPSLPAAIAILFPLKARCDGAVRGFLHLFDLLHSDRPPFGSITIPLLSLLLPAAWLSTYLPASRFFLSSALPIVAAPTHVLIKRPTRGGTARWGSPRERGDRPAGATGLSIRRDRGEVVDSRSVSRLHCTRTRQGTSFPTTPAIPFTSSR